MSAITINNVNKALKYDNLPLEMVKSDCYFWFGATPDAPMGVENYVDSIYSNHIRGMSIKEYVNHVRGGYDKFLAFEQD